MILNPDLAAAISALGENRGGDVLAPLERAAAVENAPAEHWKRALEVAARIGDDDLALDVARKFRTLAPRDPGLRAAEMQLLGETGAIRDALAIARKLESDHPTDARWPIATATMLARTNREQDAIAALHRAIRRAPGSALAWEILAGLKTFTADDPDLAGLQQALRSAREPSQVAALAYALGKAYDDLGDVDRAFAQFQRGAGQMLGGKVPRMDLFLAQAREACAAFPAERLSPAHTSVRDERPIFVLGCPRSGTTLVERILATSPAVSSGGELKMMRLACMGFTPPSPARVQAFAQRHGSETAAWQRVADTYTAKLNRRFGRADGVVDKGLVNYLYVGAIAQALPNARIVHVHRDPIDTAWSCYRRRFHDGLAWSYHFEALAAFIRVYEDVLAYWKQVLPDRILTVEFESLVSEPDATTARLFDFVGIERPADWRTFHERTGVVLTSSQLQVRKPLNAEGVGAWRRYETHLQPMLQSLARFGLVPARSAA